jgi:hypothetical protein
METVQPDISVFIGPITYIIGFIGLIFILAMLKSFISHGISIAVSEFLLNHSDEETRMKVVRWFSNGDDIMKALKRIEKNTERKKE